MTPANTTTPTTCEICGEAPVIIDELWGELDVCEDCNDGTPVEPWGVTTPFGV